MVFLLIVNQSTNVKIPQHPPVSNFKIPIPISPSMNLSIPKVPRKIETINRTFGFFKSHDWIDKKVVSSALSNFALKTGIAVASKYLALVVKYKSICYPY